MKYTSFLPLTTLLAPAAAKVYTGFNYGSFWGEQSNVKRYADFHHGFELAKNLTNAPVPFDSARLYTCITTGTKDDPTEAFQAAIDTGTNLLLGMWVSPGAAGQPNDVQVENEVAALNKGFAQHGQKLADLVIGLSVGNEDVYRFNNAQVGIASDSLLLTIKSVREKIAASPYAKYMEGKPIGHTDTAHYAVVPGSDFVGLTGYPYWEGQSIDNANISFMSLLKDTQRRAGTIPVWISEMGWPINGTQIKQAAASADNYQRYWNEVGCQVFGKYNTFWFGLLQDSQPDQPDWGLLDTKTHQPRIRDLSCGSRSNMTAPAAGDLPKALDISTSKPQPTTFSTVYLPSSASASATPSLSKQPANSTATSTQSIRTTHTTRTLTTTATPSSLSSTSNEDAFTLYLTTTTLISPTLTPDLASPSTHGTVEGLDGDAIVSTCIVMMDLLDDGVFIPVAIAPASGVESCEPALMFTGSPFTQIAASTVPVLSDQKSSFNLYAPSTTSSPLPTAAPLSGTTTADANGPTCVTSAGAVYEAIISDGKAYLGKPTISCPSGGPAASTLTITSSAVRLLSSTSARSTSLASPFSSSSSVLPPSSPRPAPAPSTLLTVTIPALVSQPASPPPVSQSPIFASSTHPPSSLASSTASAPPPSTTSPPATATPSPSTDAGCVVVNGKTWVAAWDEHGKKRISGTGLECPATPTSPPNVEPPALPILTQALEEWKTQTWAARIPLPASALSQRTALALWER